VTLEVVTREIAQWIKQLRDVRCGAVQILRIAGGCLDLGQRSQLTKEVVEMVVEEIEALHSEPQNCELKTQN